MIVDGQDYGVSAFVVPIRNDDMTPCKGVIISDLGEKLGQNGVDNGIMQFKYVWIVPI